MNHQICAGVQGTGWQRRVHAGGEVAAMGFIHQHRPALSLQATNHGCRIDGVALVGGVHEHRSGDRRVVLRQGGKHRFDPGPIWRVRLAPLTVEGQVEQEGGEVPQQTGLNQAAVGIARQQHRLAGPADAEQGCLQQPCGAIDAIPAAIHPHRCC